VRYGEEKRGNGEGERGIPRGKYARGKEEGWLMRGQNADEKGESRGRFAFSSPRKEGEVKAKLQEEGKRKIFVDKKRAYRSRGRTSNFVASKVLPSL